MWIIAFLYLVFLLSCFLHSCFLFPASCFPVSCKRKGHPLLRDGLIFGLFWYDRLSEIKAVKVHDFVPCGNKIFHELLFAV